MSVIVWGLGTLIYFSLSASDQSTRMLTLVVSNIIQLALGVYYGDRGNEWAWRSGRFGTEEDCLKCQSIWNGSVLIFLGVCVFLVVTLRIMAAGRH
ncbi:MAG: hypothetical protein M3Y56_10255 [Armatimonadota bacterium]|nr:hypothetical protein [Armatimonadota bacterium]